MTEATTLRRPCPRCGVSLSPNAPCPRCLVQGGAGIDTIGGLELVEEIGRGGMGSVFRARHLRLGREVAVKFLAPELASRPDVQARFEREAKALALLSHPNIVAVYDCGEDDGERYIVMELASGRPLSRLLPLPPERAVDVAIQVLDALAYAHRRGVVHRDIKPENVLVDAEGRVKLTDFGIARILRTDPPAAAVTSPDVAVGTPHFLAPETLAGAPPDGRVDLYAVGVLLFQVVSGRLPVGNSTALPEPLDRVVRRALEPDPGTRYQTAEEMQRDLLAARVSADELPADERNWMRAVALTQATATACALWAGMVSVTPKVVQPGEVFPLAMLVTETLADGRLVSRARFETVPILLAVAISGVAFAAYGLLRRHWRLAGLERREPHRQVKMARAVLWVGLAAWGAYLLRKAFEGWGLLWAPTYIPVIGGLIELAALYTVFATLLEAWRTSRPLSREPLLWVGLGLALLPPAIEVGSYLVHWKP